MQSECSSSSKEWPALGQAKKKKQLQGPRASTFAAAVKVQELEEESSQASSIQNAVDVGAMSWEEKKAAVRAAKLAKKEEKRIRREENARRQMFAPRGYRVQMIQSVPGGSQQPVVETPTTFPTLESSFPELGTKNIPRKLPEAICINEPNFPEAPVSDEVVSSKKKRPDKNLTVTLEHLIKSRPKKIVATKKRKIKLKIAYQERLSGNPLDSSQPVRHKGKVREVPKKKRNSSLKTAICAYRKLKQLQRESAGKAQIEKENEEKVEDVINEEPKETVQHIPAEISLETITFKDIFHSRKFREYCDNMLGKDLDGSVESLLRALAQMQDKSYQKDPQKFKKRILSGLHETRKAIIMKKAKLVIIAPDLEKCPQPGGLDSKIAEIITMAKESSIPYLFSLGRRKLGKVLFKKVPVSCAAIINAEGAEELLNVTLAVLFDKKADYASANVQKPEEPALTINMGEKKSDVNKMVVSSLLTALEQSLQAPKLPKFLQVIDSIHANEDSE